MGIDPVDKTFIIIVAIICATAVSCTAVNRLVPAAEPSSPSPAGRQ